MNRSKSRWKDSRKIRHRRKSSRASSITDTWPLAKSSRDSKVSRSRDEMSDEEQVSKKPILHVANRHFCYAVSYQTSRVVARQ